MDNQISPLDCRFTIYRNEQENSVTCLHIPTGVSATVSWARSEVWNKFAAFNEVARQVDGQP